MLVKTSHNRLYQFADLKIDPSSGQVWQDEIEIILPKLSFKLLLVLAENANKTLSQEQLIELIWQDSVVGDETLKQRVKLLRKALGDNAQTPKYIGMIRSRGYYLIPSIKILIPAAKRLPEYEFVLNNKVPNLTTVESIKLWRAMSFSLMAIISVLFVITYLMSLQLSEHKRLYPLNQLAILPFVNATNDQGDEYLAKGMTRELISMLSNVNGLYISSMQTVEQYADKPRIVDEISTRLQAGSLLDGVLSRKNNRLHFSFKLIDSHTTKILWQSEYDVDSNDLLAIQHDVLTHLTTHLEAELDQRRKESRIVLTQPTAIVKAYDTYLRGREYYYRYREDDNLVAIKLFKQAIEIDPSFSSAYAGLADAYSQANFQFGAGNEYKSLGFIAAEKAVMLNPASEVAHKALAVAQYINGNLKQAISSNLTAVKLNPRFVEATTNLAFIYRESGDLQQALKWNLRTLEIDQNYATGYLHLALTYSALNQFDLAEINFKEALRIKPDYILAKTYYQQYQDSILADK